MVDKIILVPQQTAEINSNLFSSSWRVSSSWQLVPYSELMVSVFCAFNVFELIGGNISFCLLCKICVLESLNYASREFAWRLTYTSFHVSKAPCLLWKNKTFHLVKSMNYSYYDCQNYLNIGFNCDVVYSE